MRTCAKQGASGQPQQSYQKKGSSMPSKEPESHFVPRNHQSLLYFSSDAESKQNRFHFQTMQAEFCTLESSLAAANYISHSSPGSLNFSSTSGSPLSQQDLHSDNNCGSPISVSCVTEDPDELKQKLRELENAMMGHDSNIDSLQNSYKVKLYVEQGKLKQVIIGDLKHVLVACARAVEENNIAMAEWLISELRKMVSVSGEPTERLGAYLLEGLVARRASSGSAIYKALKCKEPTGSDLLSYMHVLYEVCPYFKFGYMSANGAIADAVKDERMVHIIDFQIAQGSQWVTLIQALAARPGGPPRIRITGIDDSVSAHARGGGLHIVGQRLQRLAHSCGVPLEFKGLDMSGCDVELEHLDIRPDEALAANFAFQLHHMPDESVSTKNHRDRLLRMIKSLSPKVLTLVEQESNTNTSAFLQRFEETLDYYAAIFESIDIILPRENKERISMEQHCLARDIVNIVACEGAERVERHELFGKWRARLTMAGFRPYPLSPLVNATIKTLLESYCEHYRLEERDDVLYLGWKNRALVVSCAWR